MPCVTARFHIRIALLAEENEPVKYNNEINAERNKGAYVMDKSAADLEHLLSKSQQLLEAAGNEENDHKEE